MERLQYKVNSMKLNKTIYNKLVLQAEEAQDRGMIKLADAIYESVNNIQLDEEN